LLRLLPPPLPISPLRFAAALVYATLRLPDAAIAIIAAATLPADIYIRRVGASLFIDVATLRHSHAIDYSARARGALRHYAVSFSSRYSHYLRHTLRATGCYAMRRAVLTLADMKMLSERLRRHITLLLPQSPR